MSDIRTSEAIDGAEIESPNFADEADNSYEQMVALTTWVNTAIDMLNRGEPEVAVLAKLSHDGCPDPQAVLDRALSQPFEEPEQPEEAEVEPTPTPEGAPPDAEDRASQMDRQRGSSVRIGDVAGRLMGAYSEYGRVVARIATDEGQVEVDVEPDEAEIIEETRRDPLGEIQQFIDKFPQPDPSKKSSLLAHRENLRRASEFIAREMPTASGSVAQRLAGVDEALAESRKVVDQHIASFVEESDSKYAASQAFSMRGADGFGGDDLDFDAMQVESSDWSTLIHEGSEILVMEASVAHLASDEFTDFALQRVAHAPESVRASYLAKVEAHRDERLARIASESRRQANVKPDTDDTSDVPVEAIFY